MTRIRSGESVTRETAVVYRRRPLVVTLHPGFLTIRQKLSRESFDLPYDAVYEAAMKLRHIQERNK